MLEIFNLLSCYGVTMMVESDIEKDIFKVTFRRNNIVGKYGIIASRMKSSKYLEMELIRRLKDFMTECGERVDE